MNLLRQSIRTLNYNRKVGYNDVSATAMEILSLVGSSEVAVARCAFVTLLSLALHCKRTRVEQEGIVCERKGCCHQCIERCDSLDVHENGVTSANRFHLCEKTDMDEALLQWFRGQPITRPSNTKSIDACVASVDEVHRRMDPIDFPEAERPLDVFHVHASSSPC
ncbi:hypothetical protein T12_4650 [Trichinella patagoniensis]|uniref:Uncharacterized protein n=1 Tax=Trichinella patagoniensis TaxID=990121 RepID=A0A0V0ZDC9_9BILA|nr:hypothetical protein T12_4650 [Trichinella patagoniensis]